MTENDDKRVSVWLIILVVAACWVVASEFASAQDIRGDVSSGDNCAGKSSACLNLTGSDTLGIGLSSPSFGAAIAQCVATEASNFAFGAYGKQKVVVNYWCMGSSLYQMGKHDAAARVWCSKTDLGELYPSPGACVNDLSRGPETPVVAPPVVADDHLEAEQMHAEQIEEQAMLYADMQAKIMNLESELDRPQQTIVREVPALSDKQRAALAEVLDDER